MAKIKIKHFGPITNGFADNDGFINIDKVMVFIGGQGSGKSSIVKLISTLTWLEKIYEKKNRNIEDSTDIYDFKTLCEFQSIHNYFKSNTIIEFQGEYLNFKYEEKSVSVSFLKDVAYIIPKITYIPAERNFLSVLEVIELEKIKGLNSLKWTLEEYIKACRNLEGEISIIKDISFSYNKNNKTAYIKGKEFDNLKLSEASSGIQSVAPMLVITNYLNQFINDEKLNNINNLSFSESESLRNFVNLKERTYNEEALDYVDYKSKISELYKIFLPQYLFTIIEEIEQNLFPESQKNILFKLLEFNNNKKENHLILTTHSPYIIAYITLAMKAFKVKSKAVSKQDLLDKLDKIVPLSSAINPDETGIYQIDNEGNVISIKSVRGLITDDNYLNSSLEETNDLFSELLEIEDLCKQ
jgi:predicted ATPase